MNNVECRMYNVQLKESIISRLIKRLKKYYTLYIINYKLNSGFTIIELLVVIAVTGVLASTFLVVINPVEQMARGRDAARKNIIGQLGRAVDAYYARHGNYPPVNDHWMDTLVASGYLKQLPPHIDYPVLGRESFCYVFNTPPPEFGQGNHQLGYCYYVLSVAATNYVPAAIIQTELESNVDRSKCTNGATYIYFQYESQRGRSGISCGGAAPINF